MNAHKAIQVWNYSDNDECCSFVGLSLSESAQQFRLGVQRQQTSKMSCTLVASSCIQHPFAQRAPRTLNCLELGTWFQVPDLRKWEPLRWLGSLKIWRAEEFCGAKRKAKATAILTAMSSLFTPSAVHFLVLFNLRESKQYSYLALLIIVEHKIYRYDIIRYWNVHLLRSSNYNQELSLFLLLPCDWSSIIYHLAVKVRPANGEARADQQQRALSTS